MRDDRSDSACVARHGVACPGATARVASHGAACVGLPPAAPDHVAGQHLALVDDVMTSGNTLNEAAQTLLAAGAASVMALVVARTPQT